ncbi:hypothetical protein Tcan_01448, partial [Toxocara canis]
PATDALLLDTQHQESWNQIQDIENRRPDEPIYEEPEKMPPSFVVPLPSHLGEFQEGSPVHFEGQVHRGVPLQWLLCYYYCSNERFMELCLVSKFLLRVFVFVHFFFDLFTACLLNISIKTIESWLFSKTDFFEFIRECVFLSFDRCYIY